MPITLNVQRAMHLTVDSKYSLTYATGINFICKGLCFHVVGVRVCNCSVSIVCAQPERVVSIFIWSVSHKQLEPDIRVHRFKLPYHINTVR